MAEAAALATKLMATPLMLISGTTPLSISIPTSTKIILNRSAAQNTQSNGF